MFRSAVDLAGRTHVGSSPTLLFFWMTRYRVYLRSKLNKFLPNVLAEPARFYFWRFLRRLELVSCPINSTARRVAMKMGRQACPAAAGSVTYPFRYAPSSRPAAAGPTAHFDRNESHVIYGTGH